MVYISHFRKIRGIHLKKNITDKRVYSPSEVSTGAKQEISFGHAGAAVCPSRQLPKGEPIPPGSRTTCL